MDMTSAIAPKSDQLNADDLIAGPRTFTIDKVEEGNAEQPVNVHLVEFPGRPFRPSKTVSRLMVSAWGPDSTAYAGQRITLYRDPAVKFGAMAVGGIRLSHMSGITKRLTVALTTTRGKKALFTVDVLPDAAPRVEPKLKEIQRRTLFTTLTRKGCPEDQQLKYITDTIGRPLEHRDAITETELAQVLDALAELNDAEVGA